MPEEIDLVVTGPASEQPPQNENKEKVMNENDYAALKIESLGNIQANNRDGRNTSTLAAGVLQAAMARNFDQVGPIESRSVSGLMATPIASPTTQAKPA